MIKKAQTGSVRKFIDIVVARDNKSRLLYLRLSLVH